MSKKLKWVSVKDQLPHRNVRVVVLHGEMDEIGFDSIQRINHPTPSGQYRGFDVWRVYRESVTHWIPEPDKDE